jgi:GSH-dependent disulfide-bond oxidoreductase
MSIWSWYGNLTTGAMYGESATFLETHTYTNVLRWRDEIAERAAVKRGRMVNRVNGELSEQLHERHDAGDFDTKTQDKVAPE